jgi:hypothetical protein
VIKLIKKILKLNRKARWIRECRDTLIKRGGMPFGEAHELALVLFDTNEDEPAEWRCSGAEAADEEMSCWTD